MEIVQFVPPATVSPNAITLPAAAPDIETIVEVVIARMQSAMGAHAAGLASVAHATTAVPVGHAGAAVAQHTDHSHDLVTRGINGAPGVAIGMDNVVPTQIQDAGAAAAHDFTADNVTGCKNANMSAHGITQPADHTAAAIVAAIDNHLAAGFAGALAAHVAADVEVGMTAERLTPRTFRLNLDTEIADIVILTYHEVGSQILVA